MTVKIVLDENDEIITQEMDPATFNLFQHVEEDTLIDLDDKTICFQRAKLEMTTADDGTLVVSGLIYAYRTNCRSHSTIMKERSVAERRRRMTVPV